MFEIIYKIFNGLYGKPPINEEDVNIETLDSYRETKGILEYKKALKKLNKVLVGKLIQEAERGEPRNKVREEKLRLIQSEMEKC